MFQSLEKIDDLPILSPCRCHVPHGFPWILHIFSQPIALRSALSSQQLSGRQAVRAVLVKDLGMEDEWLRVICLWINTYKVGPPR